MWNFWKGWTYTRWPDLFSSQFPAFSPLHILQSELDGPCSRQLTARLPHTKTETGEVISPLVSGLLGFFTLSTQNKVPSSSNSEEVKMDLGEKGETWRQARTQDQMEWRDEVWIRNKVRWREQDDSDRVFPARRNCPRMSSLSLIFY